MADQDRALDFYTEKLGFTIITDQPFDEKQRWIELRVPKAETRVVLFTTDEDKNRIGTFMNMSYTCEDLQKTYEELKKRGVEFENPPKRNIGETSPSLRTAKEIASSSAIDVVRSSAINVAGPPRLSFHLALVRVRGIIRIRNATTGSTRVARRAGRRQAKSAMNARPTIAIANAGRSNGPTP